jgi:hypothetical protein
MKKNPGLQEKIEKNKGDLGKKNNLGIRKGGGSEMKNYFEERNNKR